MNQKSFYDVISEELRWNSVSDIPNFPFKSFKELNVNISEYDVNIDIYYMNLLPQYIFSAGYNLYVSTLAWIPFVLMIVSIILTFYLNDYTYLFGFLISLITTFISKPYFPMHTTFGALLIPAFLYFLYCIWNSNSLYSFLCASYLFPFISIMLLYNTNNLNVLAQALDNEILFIWLFQNKRIFLKNNKTGEMIRFDN